MRIEEIEQILRQTESAIDVDRYHDAERSALLLLETLSTKEKTNENVPPTDIEENQLLLFRTQAHRLLSRSFWQRGMSTEALPHAEVALEKAKESKNRLEEAKATLNIGIVYFGFSDYRCALQYYNDALSIFREIGNKAGIAKTSGNIGTVYRNLSEYKKALRYLEESIHVYKELEDIENLVRTMNTIGLIYKDKAEFSKAMEVYNEALKLCEESSTKSITASIMGNISTVYIALSDYDQALKCLKIALSINEDLGRKSATAHTATSIGLIYNRLCEFSHSFRYHNISLVLFKELGMKGSVAKSIGNIGIVYQGMKDYPKALDHYLKAVAIFEEMSMKAALEVGIGNIAGIYFLLGDYALALEYYEKALEMHTLSGNRELLSSVLGNIGTIYFQKEFIGYDKSKAEQYLHNAIELNGELGLKYLLYMNHLSLANLYEQENDLAKSMTHYKKYHELYIEVQNEEVKKQADKFGWERKIAEMEREREIEAIRIENDKKLLEQTIELQRVRIESQSREVESNIKELVHKNDLLHQIRNDISRIEPYTKGLGVEIMEQTLDRITRNIKSFESIDSIKDKWDVVHGDFMRQLELAFPTLTSMELKIASLLKMNLTSSNIASIIFLSKRTVEFHRFNIRKKMNIPTKADLHIYLNSLSANL